MLKDKPKKYDMLKFIALTSIVMFFLMICLNEGLRRQDERLAGCVVDGIENMGCK